MTRVLGLDLSLTATGYAADWETCGVLRVKSIGARRLAEQQSFILDMASDSDVVVIEHFGHLKGPAVFLIELHGVIKLALWQRRTPVVLVSVPTLKKYTTGRGNADKDQVLAAAIRRFDFQGDDNNAADAWLLRDMGLVAYDGEPVTEYQREALGKVSWPKLDIVEHVG